VARVQVLDRIYDVNTRIWRYIEYWKLTDLIRSKALYFTSINKLQELDKLEGIPSKPMQMIFNDPDQEYTRIVSAAAISPTDIRYDWMQHHQEHADLVYVNCWNISDFDSSWIRKNYTKLPKSMAIQSTRSRLENSFNNSSDLLSTGCVKYINHESHVSGP
jgi:hypothetical protein